MAEEFEKGDEVECSSHGGTASGEVEERITRRAKAAGRPVSASEDDPQYLVKSEKSGGGRAQAVGLAPEEATVKPPQARTAVHG